jgi:hypothetical protein
MSEKKVNENFVAKVEKDLWLFVYTYFISLPFALCHCLLCVFTVLHTIAEGKR